MADKEKMQEEEQKADTNAWMVTFSDLLTLMITFFVLLLSMSSMDNNKLKNMFSAFSDSLGVLEMGQGQEIKTLQIKESVEMLTQELLLEMRTIKNLLNEARSGDIGVPLNMLKGSEQIDEMVTMDDRGVVVTFSDAILFDKGSAELNEAAYPMINRVAERLKVSEFNIAILGHSDASPAGSEASNWYISSRRAVNVMKYLNEVVGVDMNRLSARGYAEHSPIVDNSTPEKRAKNRRVEIVLSKK